MARVLKCNKHPHLKCCLPGLVQVVLTNDFDGLTLWHNLHGARATSGLLSRGEFGAIGAGRLLDLFDKRKIKSA
jgi:hypothetical protein